VHRPLYNWFIEQLGIFPSKQREFARLNLNYTVMSKRKLLKLVQEGYVNGWDDPRMPTLSGLRRRGYTPEAIRNFADRIGVAKRDGVIDVALLEFSVREHLNKIADRKMAVLNPLKLIIENYPEGESEILHAVNNPEDEDSGKREVPFGREVYIDQSDFMIDPPKKFFRLGPGRVVRLKYAYIIECTGYKTDDAGNIVEVTCKYYPESKSGEDTTGIKVKSALSWVPVDSCVTAEVRQYDRLFSAELPDGDDYIEHLNPDSLSTITDVKLEPSAMYIKQGQHIQFERQGYFVLDYDSTPESMIFNRTVTLRDNWAKQQNRR
jgi:glutaminyl-tRNA synthetase